MEACNIRSHDVGGKLRALEIQSRHAGQGGGQGGLTRTGDVLDEDVGPRQHSGQQQNDLGALTHHYLFHLVGGGDHFLVGGGHLGGHFHLGGLIGGFGGGDLLFGFVAHNGIPFLIAGFSVSAHGCAADTYSTSYYTTKNRFSQEPNGLFFIFVTGVANYLHLPIRHSFQFPEVIFVHDFP